MRGANQCALPPEEPIIDYPGTRTHGYCPSSTETAWTAFLDDMVPWLLLLKAVQWLKKVFMLLEAAVLSVSML